MSGDPERGAALLTVLLMVAVLAVIATVMLDRLTVATRLAGNVQAMTQARLAVTGAEALTTARLQALVSASQTRTVDTQGLLGREAVLPLGAASVRLKVEDAGNCFNVNSFGVQRPEGFIAEPRAVDQFVRLATALGVSAGDARAIGTAAADWIDSDSRPLPGGAEDDYYLAQPVPHRTAGRLLGEASELRAVKGMTPEIYAKLQPWLCAVPAAVLSPVNINTLRPDQALVLTMVAPGIGLQQARAAILARPPGGYADAAAALRALGGGNGGSGPDGVAPVLISSRWFVIDQTVTVDRVTLRERSLIDARLTPARVVFRSWGDPAE